MAIGDTTVVSSLIFAGLHPDDGNNVSNRVSRKIRANIKEAQTAQA